MFSVGTNDEKTVAAAIGVNPYFMKDYKQAAKSYTYSEVEKVLLLLHNYNLKSVGIGSSNTGDGALMKEMVAKMLG
jgi:DNA polymerase-3 subunit delta